MLANTSGSRVLSRLSDASESHENSAMPRVTAPWASCTEPTEAALWENQASQYRYPSSLPAGLKASELTA